MSSVVTLFDLSVNNFEDENKILLHCLFALEALHFITLVRNLQTKNIDNKTKVFCFALF